MLCGIFFHINPFRTHGPLGGPWIVLLNDARATGWPIDFSAISAIILPENGCCGFGLWILDKFSVMCFKPLVFIIFWKKVIKLPSYQENGYSKICLCWYWWNPWCWAGFTLDLEKLLIWNFFCSFRLMFVYIISKFHGQNLIFLYLFFISKSKFGFFGHVTLKIEKKKK